MAWRPVKETLEIILSSYFGHQTNLNSFGIVVKVIICLPA